MSNTELSAAVAAAEQVTDADLAADEAARLAYLAWRKQTAISIAELEAWRESERRGRPVYWRTWQVTIPAYRRADGLTTDPYPWTLSMPTVQKTDASGDRYTDAELFGLANQAASIATDQFRKPRKNQRTGETAAPLPISEAERDCLAQELAASLLETDFGRHPKRGSIGSPEDGATPAQTRAADLAALTGQARNLIARGSEDGDRASWRDCYGATSWGSAVGSEDGSLTLADVTGEDDLLAGSMADAERDPYMDGAAGTDPASHADYLAVAGTGLGKAERRTLLAALTGSATSSDWLAADGKPATRQARRDWRKSRDRGSEALALKCRLGGEWTRTLAALARALRGSYGSPLATMMRQPGISSTTAAKHYRATAEIDRPTPVYLAARQSISYRPRDLAALLAGTDRDAIRRWIAASRTGSYGDRATLAELLDRDRDREHGPVTVDHFWRGVARAR